VTIVTGGSGNMRDIKGKWSGKVDQFSHDHEGTVAVRLTIDEVTGDEFVGTMDWPTIGCVTQVQGYLDGERMIWSETDYLKGEDVVLYGLYVAQLKSDREIEGDWMDPKHTIYPKGPSYGVAGASFALARE
jgi:hypothetical protein